MTDGEAIDRIERAEPFAKKLRGVLEVVAAGPCADAQAAELRRIADTIGDVPIMVLANLATRSASE